jgi:hypothetical protein
MRRLRLPNLALHAAAPLCAYPYARPPVRPSTLRLFLLSPLLSRSAFLLPLSSSSSSSSPFCLIPDQIGIHPSGWHHHHLLLAPDSTRRRFPHLLTSWPSRLIGSFFFLIFAIALAASTSATRPVLVLGWLAAHRASPKLRHYSPAPFLLPFASAAPRFAFLICRREVAICFIHGGQPARVAPACHARPPWLQHPAAPPAQRPGPHAPGPSTHPAPAAARQHPHRARRHQRGVVDAPRFVPPQIHPSSLTFDHRDRLRAPTRPRWGFGMLRTGASTQLVFHPRHAWRGEHIQAERPVRPGH